MSKQPVYWNKAKKYLSKKDKIMRNLIYKYSDARKVPANASERVKKNMEEGRGFRLKNLGNQGGDFMFSSANPMWRASLETLDLVQTTNGLKNSNLKDLHNLLVLSLLMI